MRCPSKFRLSANLLIATSSPPCSTIHHGFRKLFVKGIVILSIIVTVLSDCNCKIKTHTAVMSPQLALLRMR
jgi:hypothetical protein